LRAAYARTFGGWFGQYSASRAPSSAFGNGRSARTARARPMSSWWSTPANCGAWVVLLCRQQAEVWRERRLRLQPHEVFHDLAGGPLLLVQQQLPGQQCPVEHTVAENLVHSEFLPQGTDKIRS
jgi:hypothetical protein